ncbi:MAG: GDYXXLXY domain-containing protein [Myxococcota bacterium]
MTGRKWCFVLAVALQLAQIAGLWWTAEAAAPGQAYRFQTAPIDPVDAFRGRYVRLNFAPASVPWADDGRVAAGGDAFASLGVDTEGFAVLEAAYADPPEGLDVVPVRVLSAYEHTASVRLAFDRYYLPEHEAPRVEAEMRRGAESFAVVRVEGAHALLEDLVVDPRRRRPLAPARERIGVPEGERLPEDLVTAIERFTNQASQPCRSPAECVAFPVDLDPQVASEWVFVDTLGALHYFVETKEPREGQLRYQWRAVLRRQDHGQTPSAGEIAALLAQPGRVEDVTPALRELRLGDVVVGVHR